MNVPCGGLVRRIQKNIETCLLRGSDEKEKTTKVLAIDTDHLAFKLIKFAFLPEVICSVKSCDIKPELNSIHLNRSVNISGIDSLRV